MIFRNSLILLKVLAVFCLIFIIGCSKQPELVPFPEIFREQPILSEPKYREIIVNEIVYTSVNPAIQLSHDKSVKWLRDNGYSVTTNDKTYKITGQNGGKNTNMNISVGATVIGITVYDKYSVNVGSLSIIDDKILVTINRKGTVKPVIKRIPIN